jgi:hypothetical protein
LEPDGVEAGGLGLSVTTFSTLDALQKIVDALNKAGEPTTATTLKRYHDCDSPQFNDAVALGTENGILENKKYGVISLIAAGWKIPERDYYDPCIGSIRSLWLSAGYQQNEFFIENTSTRDSKISGRWTRPDLTMISRRTFAWTVGEEFDVTTFEIKRPDACNVLAVFEALSHTSAATKGYVVFPVAKDAWQRSDPAQAERVMEECNRLGIGLILIEDVGGDAKPIHFIAAQRRSIDHQKCSEFLDAVLSDAGKKHFAKW